MDFDDFQNAKNDESRGPQNEPKTESQAPSGAHPETAAPGPEDKNAGAKDHKKREKAESEDARSFKARLKKKEHEIKSLRKDLEESNDRFLRAAAEMDNQRKRLDREKADFLQFALSDVLRELLPILDNFERALKNRDQTDGAIFAEGLGLIHKQFLGLLRKQGVTPIETSDMIFNPEVHQAVMTEESDEAKEPSIGEELQRGYKLRDRLLRPALVKVIIPKKS
jgi:molecular chaperone GrpE